MHSLSAIQIRAAALTHYEEVLARFGLSPQPLLNKVGLTPSMLASPTQMISYQSAVALLEISAQETGCDTFGLQMAQARRLSDFGPISLLLMQQSSIRMALNTIAQYRHLLNEALAMQIEDLGKNTLIREEIITDYVGGNRQSTDMAVGVLMVIFRAILGPHWRPQSVHFTHSAQHDLEIHRQWFGCTPQFDSDFNGLICLSSDMDKPNGNADSVMARYAQSFIEAAPQRGRSSVVLDVRHSIYLLLPMGRATVAQIASGLGMNVRTLQRHLDQSGVSFSQVLNEVRHELAHRYIVNTPYSMGRVAEQLGYANLSSFTRWFSAEFGCAPSDMRTQQGA